MPSTPHQSIQELLMRHGLEPKHARGLAINELLNWKLEDLDELFKHVQRPSPDFAFFKSDLVKPTSLPTDAAKRNFLHEWWPSLWDRAPRWASAPRSLMERAAKEGSALCINVKGEWQLRTDAYVALSHVWAEGLQRDQEHGGLEMTKIVKVFELMARAGLEEEWMWTDVLAIPSGQAVVPLEDELLITDLINTMPEVYGKASAVLIIDAIVLQLHSTETQQLILALACGKWARRVWTYQEIKLANKALVVTATGAVEFQVLIDWLERKANVDRARFHSLYLWAAIMGKNDKVGLTIRDLLVACSGRSSGLDVDYARAVFPLLRLKWEAGMTREQGMQKIYFLGPRETAIIASKAGSPRMKLNPGWAPSYLQGLEGPVNGKLKWEARGIRGQWFMLRVKRLLGSTSPKFGRIGLNIEVDSETDSTLQCVTAEHEDPQVVEEVKKKANEGRLMILSATSFRERITTWAQSVLIVEEAITRSEHGVEAMVHCSATMGTPGIRQDAEISLLIRHGNPNVDSDLFNQLKYHWHCQEDLTNETGDEPLHAAVRAGDVRKAETLLKNGADTLVYDVRGNTVLHVAAALDNTDMLACLLPRTKDVNIGQESGSRQTALTLAASLGKTNAVRYLLDHGLDIESRNNSDYTSLMMAACECRADTVRLLLEQGADPNARDERGFSGSPLLLATGKNDRALEVIELLVRGGADVNPTFHPVGWTPLLKASDQGNDGEVELLLSHGARVNVADSSGRTPLHNALYHARLKSVRLLLDAGADREAMDNEQARPIHRAAQCGNYEIMQMLLDSGAPIDVNARLSEKQGMATALHVAVANENSTMVKLLLHHGAKVDLKNGKNTTALDVARQKDNTGIVAILESAQANNGG